MPSETSIGGDNVRFQPTAWTIVRSASTDFDLLRPLIQKKMKEAATVDQE